MSQKIVTVHLPVIPRLDRGVQVGILGFILSTCVLAEPVVIFKGEKAVSAETYLSPQKGPAKTADVPKEVLRQELAGIRQEALKRIQSQPPYFHFPYKTEGLTLGKVAPKNISNSKIPRPFFLVGTDEHSRAWLQKNLGRFKSAGAIGFIVEAKSWDEYQLVKQIAEKEQVAVARFEWDGFTKKLGIDHYPVLVTATSIEQ